MSKDSNCTVLNGQEKGKLNGGTLLIFGFDILTGDWKGNLEHIYAHLIDRCKKNTQFRNAIGQPQIGFVSTM